MQRQQNGLQDFEIESRQSIQNARALDEQEKLQPDAKAVLASVTPETEEEGFADKVNAFHDEARDVVLKAPMNIAKGAYKAYTNTLDLFINRNLRKEAQAGLSDLVPGVEEASSAIDQFMSGAEETPDEVVQGLAQFFVPFTGYMKVFQAAKASPLVTAFAADFTAATTALDPHMDRLADLAQNLGLENEFIDYLASDEGGEVENRLKNGIDSVLAGAAATGLFASAKVMHKAMREADGFTVGAKAQQGAIKPKPKSTTRAIIESDVRRGPKPKNDALISEKKLPPGAVVTADEMAVARFDEFDTRKEVTHQINFDRVKNDDDVNAVLAATADRFKLPIDDARRGKITNEQLQGLADDLNTNVDVILPIMERRAGDQTLTPEMVVASRKVLNDSAAVIRRMAERVAKGDATLEEQVKFRRQMEFHTTYQSQFMGARAEVGRALQAFNIPLGTTDAGMKHMQQLTERFHGGDLSQIAKDISTFDDASQLNKYVRDTSLVAKAGGVAREIYINSILSSPKTHVINLTGNAIFQGMNITERAVAARIGRFMSGPEHVEVGEAQAQLFGALSGISDAWRLAWQTFKTGDTAMNKLDGPMLKAISSENLEISGWLGRAVDYLGAFIRLPTERVMAPGDEFFKAIAYRSDVARAAFRESGGDANKIRELMADPSQKMLEDAESYALYSTFQNPAGPISEAFQSMREKVPGMWVVLPFIRTPGNILKEAGLRSPIAPLMSTFRQQVKAGGASRDMALARLSLGSATAAGVSAFVLDGALTGGGPSNHQARMLLEETGWQPYSVRLPDGSYQSYQRAEPVSMVIGAVADMTEIMARADHDDPLVTEDERVTDLANALVAGIAENSLNKTYLSGLSEFFHAMDDPGRFLPNYTKRVGQALVPYSLLRRDIARVSDPYLRQAWTLMDKIQSQVPGYSDELPFSRDVFGNARKPRSGAIMKHMSPFPDTELSDDPLVHEIARVMDSTRRVPITMPNKRINGMALNAKEYSDLVDLSRNRAVMNGQTFEESLSAFTQSSLYDQLPDDAKVEQFKKLQRAYDEAGKAMLLQENESLSARVITRELLKQTRGL